MKLLAGLAADGAAVLMATHDSRLAAWADRVVFLRDGRAIEDDDDHDDDDDDEPRSAPASRPGVGGRR